MSKLELLKAVYESIDWGKLYRLLPQASRQQVDQLFQDLREKLALDAEPPEGAAGKVKGGEAYLYCDGASRGNPGPAAIGMVLTAPDGAEVLAWGQPIGRATNNVAEYRSVAEGLRKALELEVRRIRVLCDSELLVRQVRGQYKVKSPGLKPLHADVLDLLARFERWQVEHIPRTENARADAIATQHAKPQRPRPDAG